MNDQELAQIKTQGFFIQRSFLPLGQRIALEGEFRSLVAQHYTPENLRNHSVYPADISDNRESHALMIAEDFSPLPAIAHSHCPEVASFLRWHNVIISRLTGTKVEGGARSLLNWQEYRSGSKAVGEHFDGEYLRADKRDAVEFTLLEGILPRYVCVLVLKNENNGKGIELIKNGELNPVSLDAGDVVFFDNIALRHRVPQLTQPRTTIGLRNFDHQALHFVRDSCDAVHGCHYHPIAEGLVSDEVDCGQRFRRFLAEEWPALRDTYGAYV